MASGFTKGPARPIPASPLTDEQKNLVTPEAARDIERLVDQEIEDELRKEAEQAYAAEYRKQARQKRMPNEALHDIRLTLPEHSPYIMLDGKVFWPGVIYHVRKVVYDSLNDIMYKAWWHEGQTREPAMAALTNEYRQQMNSVLSGKEKAQ